MTISLPESISEDVKDRFLIFFGVHKIMNLEQGGSIEITDFKSLPKSVQEHLEEIKPKKAKKGDK